MYDLQSRIACKASSYFSNLPASGEVLNEIWVVSTTIGVWHTRCGVWLGLYLIMTDRTLHNRVSKKEERKWARLQLAIPVFVRARDGDGRDSLEFATAINVSPGGALVVVRRCLPKSASVSLEIPSAPIGPAQGLKTPSRIMQAKAVWVTHLDGYHLLGLKFTRPLNTDVTALAGVPSRKAASVV